MRSLPWRVRLCLVVVALSMLWASTMLWPVNPTATWPWVAEAQASAWVGSIALLAAAVGALRSWRQAIVGLLVVAVALLAVPRIPNPFPAGVMNRAEETWLLRVMSLNTFFGRAEDEAIIAAVRDIGPDVLVLSETNPREVEVVAAAAGYVVVNSAKPGRGGADGVTILLRRGAVTPVAGGEFTGITRFQFPFVRLRSSGEGAQGQADIQVFGVHVVAPISHDRSEWAQELRALGDFVSEQDGPIIVTGDFNATRNHPGLRALNLRDCTGHVAHTPTWPNPVPVIRLDHVLVGGASCQGGGVVRVEGTDHRAVWADVAG